MAEFGRILKALTGCLDDKRGVSSAEYAILAVGIVIVVGSAITILDMYNPMQYAASALLSGQASLATGTR